MHYSAYNLTIRSVFTLPELHASNADEEEGEADVRIGWGEIPADGFEGGRQIGRSLWVGRERLLLRVPGVARFLVSNGNEILVDPEPGSDDESIRLFLLGSAFGALLFQRGYLVLHGNAVRIGDQCMVCVGRSGAGKSTLATGFMRRGFSVLADDVVPVDAECRALPGFPRIKLWQDVADRLEIDTGGLPRIRPSMEKFNLPIDAGGMRESLPIRWVFVLGSGLDDEMRLEPIRGMDRFRPLRNHTYRVRYLEGMDLGAEHLRLCAKLAERIRLARLTRPGEGFHLEPMIDRILDHIAENP